jgi:glucosamine--fructose-6-phosphate aminotransferase (isomerizing)
MELSMCGIVGYIGKEANGITAVISGLQSLEYRGYDSAGIAYLGKQRTINFSKQVGRVKNLEESLLDHGAFPAASTAIGHTRWATHGTPTITNAHPHYNHDETIAVVHNGIIENHQELRALLESKGYIFVSETDTEVIPHLIDFYARQSKTFTLGLENALSQLRGAYALLVMYTETPDTLYAVRLSSPLVVGLKPDAVLVASDPMAIIEHTQQVIYLNDYELAEVHRDGTYELKDLRHSRITTRKAETLSYDSGKHMLGEFAHYMLKEMHEAPETIRSATQGRIRPSTNTVKLGGLENVADQLRYIDRIVIVACGTSYYAGLVGEYLIEEIAGIPVEVQLGSEFKYRNEPFSRGTAILAVSQSGETADTIAALKKVENYGVLRLGVVNTVGSTVARMTDAGVYCHAGPEQAVASTKAFIAQVSVLTLIALHLSGGNSPLFKPILRELEALPDKANEVLEQIITIEKIAQKYKHTKDFLYIGRTYGYPCALEGALKLKEISYIHAEAYAAGEMKHGPLAMIDHDFPTFAIATDTPMLEKIMSNIQEIKARNGPVLAIATHGNKNIKNLASDTIYIPKTLEQTQPILIALVEQLFAYYIAVANDRNVDRPRNLAKSVTVE